MKILKKISIMTIALITALFMTGTCVSAQSSNIDGSCYFDGSRIVSDFDSGVVATAITDLQPGDDVTFTVKYTNEFEESTDWYMSNKVLQTLEKANNAKKVEGTGQAENGGYTYQLIHTDNNGNSNVLFDNSKVGGEAKPLNMQGLEQATNALDEWFYIQTLAKGESGVVTLKVAFEGETEVNDYMDTKGEVMIKFAVELTPKTAAKTKHYKGNGVATGDSANLWPWILAMLAAGLLLLLLALRSRRKDDEAQRGGDEV